MITNEAGTQWVQSLVKVHQQIKEEWPWVGIATLRNDSDMMSALKDLFAGKEEP